MAWGIFKKIKDGFLKAKSKIGNFIKQATPSKNVMSKLNSARNTANKVNNILPDLDFK